MAGLYLGSYTDHQRFQCTRHATSCNNIDMGKSLLGKDSEPALSVYGITEAITLAAREQRSNRFKIPYTSEGHAIPIAVSGLIRTWETSVLLYGYQLHTRQRNQGYTTLSLRICPWLRETSGYGSTFDVGNIPKPLKHSIPKFIKFLNILITAYDFADRNYQINTIYIYIPSELATNDASLSSKSEWQLIQIHLDASKNEYILHDNLCHIHDTIFNGYGYQNEVGDIMKFMKWYSGCFPHDTSTTVHMVAHSQIMQAFAKTHLHINLEKEKRNLKEINPRVDENVTQQNCWSMTMEYRSTYDPFEINEIIRSIQNGFNKPKGDRLNQAKDNEHSKQSGNVPISLCGSYGSVSDIPCTSGGRRTRRKKHHRKRTLRKHNKHNKRSHRR